MTPILFDFNGTMFLDTEENEVAWREEIRTIAHHEVTDEEFKNFLHGALNEVIVRHFAGSDLPENLVHQYALDKETIYRRLCLERTDGMQLTKGLPEVLDYLKAHKVPMTIASSAMPINMDFYFEHMHLDKWFERSLVVCNDGKLPGKPDPAFYLAAAAKLNVPATDCLVLEDAISGVHAAQAAKVKSVVAVASTNTSDYWRQQKGIDYIMEDFTAFLAWYK